MQEVADTRDVRAVSVSGRLTPQITYVTAVVLFVLDRILKNAALSGTSLGANGVVAFELFKNPGIAFSIPLAHAIFWPLAGLIYLGLAVVLALGLRRHSMATPFLVLIMLGATSNLIDRFVHAATIDYVIFFGRAAVNIADGMIVAGALAILTLPRTIRSERPK